MTSNTSVIRGRHLERTASNLRRASLVCLVFGIAEPGAAWSRILAVSATAPAGGDGSASHPYASITACLSTAQANDTCELAEGTYAEEIIPPRDGVTIEAASGAMAVVTATDSVHGWTPDGNGVFAAHVPIVRTFPAIDGVTPTWPGTMLLRDGALVPQARWPAPSPDPLRPNWARIGSGHDDCPSASLSCTGLIQAAGIPAFIPTPDTTIRVWSGPDPYTEYEGAVTAAPGGQVIYTPHGNISGNSAAAGGLFTIVGARELLTPDTWIYDSASATLRYKPKPGIDPNTEHLRVKTRPAVADLSGRSNITLRGLVITGGGIITDASSANDVVDTILARDLTLSENPHSLAPSLPVDLYNAGIVLQGTNDVLEHSRISGSNFSGATLAGTGNRVIDTFVDNVDWFGDGAAGVAIVGGRTATTNPAVLDSTIRDVGGSAITLTVQPKVANTNALLTVSHPEIAYNALERAMWLRDDGGVIYACCKVTVPYALVHDNAVGGTMPLNAITHPYYKPTPNGPAPTAGLSVRAGIYVDNGIGGILVYENTVWHAVPDLFLHGASNSSYPTDDDIIAVNSTPDASSRCNLEVSASNAAKAVAVLDNRTVYQTLTNNIATTGLLIAFNGPLSLGATTTSHRGCSFADCAIAAAPAFPTRFTAGGLRPSCPAVPPG